ncbi:MAG: hypothetical protein ACD_4C00251G0002 [uncultured bacterium (gcode 4)]|uniref:Uncharacterized protein n=1 Tax=uncultured bacterium (gcode 4) TaxID=1234023 RepID=K2FUC9_9BACT|nr:MAG: hypothetical protein ACD_4C00251G0002 [uncultured bacterium (gcode 4)]
MDWNWEYKYRHCYYNESKSALNSIKNRRFDMIFYWSDLCKDDEKGCRNLVRLSDHITWSDINELLILKGYAFSWTNFSSIPLDLKIKYIKAERRAKESWSWLWWKCETSFNFLAKIDSSIPTKMTK